MTPTSPHINRKLSFVTVTNIVEWCPQSSGGGVGVGVGVGGGDVEKLSSEVHL